MNAVPTASLPETSQSRSRSSIVSSAMTLFSGQLAIKVVSFVFSVVVIRHLGSAEYGKYAVCVAFGGLFTVLSDLGLATLAVKRIARDHRETPALFSNVLVLRLLLAAFVVVATALTAWIVGYEPEIRLGILIASLGLLAYALHGTIDAVAMGHERFRFSASLAVGTQVVTLVLAALLVFGGGGFLGLLAAATLGALIVALVGFWRLRRIVPLRGPISPSSWGGMTRAAMPFAATTLALAISYRADAVILSGFADTRAIGEYAVAYSLIFTFVTLSHSVNMALFPAMMREQATDPERARELFRRGLQYLAFVSLPVAVCVSLLADDIVRLLYGDDLAGVARPLAVLIWVVPLMFISEFLGYVAIVVDRERLVARANWAASGSNIALNLLFIPIFGVMAAAVTTVLTEVLLVGQFVVALRASGVFAERWRAIGRTLVACLVLGATLLLLSLISLHVLIAGVLAVAVYLGAAVLTRAVGRDELAFARSLLRE